MAQQSPEIIEVNSAQLEDLLARASSNKLGEEDTELMRHIFASYAQLFQLVGDKNTTIARLRKLCFGAKSEKASQLFGDDQAGSPSAARDDEGDSPSAAEDNSTDVDADSRGQITTDEDADSDSQAVSDEDDSPPPVQPAAGHGRYAADAYAGGSQVQVTHPTLAAGDDCPECGQGTLYDKKPSVLVRFVGQAPLQATVYRLQKLRCHLCGKVFTASAPPGVGERKYDHSVASMIGLLKYGSGFPFNRVGRLQGSCEIPLAASTQWDIVHAAADLLLPAYEELIRQAAQGQVVHNDDTTVKILELMGERFKKAPPADDEHDPKRTGLFTSGIVATLEGLRLALFFSGRRHAGENLSKVLQHRAAELEAPLHMCDGLARNLPRELQTILANCLTHGRRKFVELCDRFPDQCRRVIEALKAIYHHDQVARDQQMSADERLAYHQAHSRVIMDDLKVWLQSQLDDKLVEPNSALGEAINYMLRRWEPLTLFLRKAGAPLDNNICERALKKAILHRKNSMFYKTRNGARVGDLYMSLIYTCELNGVNALDYLNQLQLNAPAVAEQPDRWMPWNYRQPLNAAPNAA